MAEAERGGVDETEQIEIRSRVLKQSFESPSVFIEWLRAEDECWDTFAESKELSASDPLRDFGKRGAEEHAAEYRTYLNSLIEPTWSEPNDLLAAAHRTAKMISERIDEGSLIISTSIQGQRIKALRVADVPAAHLLVTLFTGRNITRTTAPQNAKLLWRGLARIISGAGDGDTLLRLEDADRLVADLRVKAASASSLESEIDRLLGKSRIDAETRHQQADIELRAKLEELDANSAETISGIQTEWTSLRAAYDTKFALQAPVEYWKARRKVHRLGAICWGFASLIYAGIVSVLMIPIGKSNFEEARILWGASAGPSVSHYLPEIFSVGVVAFISLWVLRFTVRQASEHLARGEEASQRVTMAETFLALSNPGEGKAALVGEADRAVIVQALFRPSAHSGIDDAPPAHWIEDVFRRIKGGDSPSR